MKQTIHVKLKLHDGERTFKIGNVFLGPEGLIVVAEIIPTHSNVNAIMEPSEFVTVETTQPNTLNHKVYFINYGRSIPTRLLAENQSEVTSMDMIAEIRHLTPLQKVTQNQLKQAKVSSSSLFSSNSIKPSEDSSDVKGATLVQANRLA